MSTKKSKLMAASVAGLLTLGALATFSTTARAEAAADTTVPCYGINACKGTGDCGGKDHSCAGQNACKGAGWIKLNADTCGKIQGGRLTA